MDYHVWQVVPGTNSTVRKKHIFYIFSPEKDTSVTNFVNIKAPLLLLTTLLKQCAIKRSNRRSSEPADHCGMCARSAAAAGE